jgi:hypothetical protein
VQVAKAKGQLHEINLGHHLITEAKGTAVGLVDT